MHSNAPLDKFLSLLADNTFEVKADRGPSYDPRETNEVYRDYVSDMEDFKGKKYFELNGFNTSGEIKGYLDNLWIDFPINQIKHDAVLKSDVLRSLKGHLQQINSEIGPAESINNKFLIAAFSLKKEYCLKAINALEDNKKEPKSLRGLSYKWLKRPDEIPKLHDLLFRNDWIDGQTTIEQFQDVFSQKPISELNPIIWKDDGVSSLIHFLDRLKQKKVIDDGKKKQFNAQLLRQCFRQSSGQQITQNIPQLKNNIAQKFSPTKKDTIDKIIDEVVRATEM